MNDQEFPKVVELGPEDTVQSLLYPTHLQDAIDQFVASLGCQLSPPLMYSEHDTPTRILSPTDETLRRSGAIK